MEPGAASIDEPADRRLGPERPEELDVAVADVEQRRLDSLLAHGLAVDERHLERPFVDRDRLPEVGDGDADVVDQVEHLPPPSLIRDALGPQDLGERRPPHLELLRRRLSGRDEALDLAADGVERATEGRARAPVCIGE